MHAKLGPYQPRFPVEWAEYAGGWNAIAIRFTTAAKADDVFTASISQSTSPPLPERQVQEEAWFAFCVAGYSAIESFAYALFALGSMLQPTNFPTSPQTQLRKITPALTQKKFAAHFAAAPVKLALSALVADPHV